jgi:hypothetical protein
MMRESFWKTVRAAALELGMRAKYTAALADSNLADCAACAAPVVPLDGVDLCVGCGDIKVAVVGDCELCQAGVPMSRNGSTHCVDDCGHGSIAYPCTRLGKRD